MPVAASSTICKLDVSSQAVIDRSDSDPRTICGDKTTKKLKHLHSGSLRPDLGPYFKCQRELYDSGKVALNVEEDGSAFAYYPNGKRAICVSQAQKARRFSAMFFGNEQGSPWLGSINEWGLGKIESAADEGGSIYRFVSTRDAVSVTKKSAETGAVLSTESVPWATAVDDSSFQRIQMPVAASSTGSITLRVCFNRFAKHKAETSRGPGRTGVLGSQPQTTGVILADFRAEKVKHTFVLGIVPPSLFDPSNAGLALLQIKTMRHSDPQQHAEDVRLETAGILERTSAALSRAQSDLTTALPGSPAKKMSTSTRGGGSSSSSALHHQTVNVDPVTGRHLFGTIKDKFAAVTGAAPVTDLDGTFENLTLKLTKNRVEYNVERELAQKVAKANPTFPRLAGSMTNETTGESAKIGIKYLSGKLMLGGESKLKASKGIDDGHNRWFYPKTVQTLSHDEMEDALTRSKAKMFVVCFHAPWDPQSKHAEKLMQVACACAKKFEKSIDFAMVDMAERGALISDRRFVNELAHKYSVTATPWLLVFSKGVLMVSKKMTGFVERLRFETFAKPRALLVEIPGTVVGERGFPYGPENQRRSKNALVRAQVDADHALSGKDAMLLAGRMTPPYGLVFASSEVPYSELEGIRGMVMRRNPGCLFFLIHHDKKHIVCPETQHRLLDNPAGVDYVFRRPLATSRIQSVLAELTHTEFALAGESGHQFWDYLKQLLELKT
ncbi:unnamed protein product [Amoebophrya sp. A120]|nr:unnamed protein product [Amoebophrya sp. A120]|eukprot:GSA120T00012971001.1